MFVATLEHFQDDKIFSAIPNLEILLWLFGDNHWDQHFLWLLYLRLGWLGSWIQCLPATKMVIYSGS